MRGVSQYCAVGAFLLGLLRAELEPAWGYPNNGWETNYIYATHAATGAIEVWTETGQFTDTTVTAANTRWYSLTFAGTGENDARLFAAKFEPHWTQGTTKDVRIVEFDPAGEIVADQDVTLGDLLGVTDVYGQVMLGCIRYSSRHNSLFVSVSDETGTNGAAVHEIDLDLTTVLNTYLLPTYNLGRHLGMDINPDTGMLYVVATGLNSAADEGDLIVFDTSAGSTTSYTTLIDSDSLVDPNNDYHAPKHVTYRGTNNPENEETVLITFKNGDQNDPMREYYLNQTDGGNLRLRATYLPTAERLVGQLDVLKQSVWLASARSSTAGVGAGYHELTSGDATSTYGNEWNKAAWWDIDSPGTVPGTPKPVIAEVMPDPMTAPSETPYLQELAIVEGAPPIIWSVVEGPPTAEVVGDENGAIVSGWTPGANDIGSTFTFEIRAANFAGSDTQSWTVNVFDKNLSNNGFRKDWVYQCIAPGAGGSRINAYKESDGSVAVEEWHSVAWHSLTFAGTGDTGARLFVTKPDPYWSGSSASHGVLMAELDADGNVINQQNLGVLTGDGARNLGSDVVVHKIRYSSYHNTLFLSVTRDLTGGAPAEVFEIDLGLSAILNTYTGPVSTSHIAIDVDPNDGTLYVTGENLGGAGPNDGDLIAFDTSAGSTSLYTTLIDAATLGDPHWQAPYHVVYRGNSNPGYRPTILVLMMGLTDEAEPQLEFYLDEKDGNGNLIKRGEPFHLRRGSGGDLDLASRAVWVTDSMGGGSLQGLLPDDTHFHPTSSGSGTDSASPPGVHPCNWEIFADLDRDGDVDQQDFGVFQRCYAGPEGEIPSEPKYCVCLDRCADSEDPGQDGDIDEWDFLAFAACATGPAVPFDPGNPPCGCLP